MSTEERRIRKSKSAIDDACWSLLRERDFASITVGEIAERADINRGTFYRHYADKYEWLERQIEHLMAEFFSFRDLLDADSGFAWAFRHFDEHFESYSILFSDRTGLPFQNRFTEWLANHLREQTEKDPSSVETEFEIQYLAASVSGMLRWWVLSSRPLPPERMAERMLELYRSVLGQV